MKKQKITIALATLTLLATVLFAAPVAFAQNTTTNSGGNFFQGLIQFIEQKFGLNQAQVQSAISDYKAQNKPAGSPRPTLTPEQIQTREKTRLDKLVTAGKITGDQETAILNELAVLNTKYNLSGLTGTQRRTQIQAMQTELKAWAQSQNINAAYVTPMFGGMGGLRGMDDRGTFHGKWGLTPLPTPTPTP
jgi:hypothetical protein